LSTDKFKEYVEELVETKDIKSYKNYSTDVDVSFELEESKDGMECTLENLKLTSSVNTNNMVLFTHKGVLKKYENISEILYDFCHLRYAYYVKRKEYIIDDLEKQLKILKNKMNIKISLVL
jgi:DNA topoisomerase-2